MELMDLAREALSLCPYGLTIQHMVKIGDAGVREAFVVTADGVGTVEGATAEEVVHALKNKMQIMVAAA